MGYKMTITFLFVALLIGGCSKQMHFTSESFDAEGNLTERIKVKYIGAAGSSDMENIQATIGKKEDPLAYLSVGSSSVDMDKFYEMYTEVSQMMILFMEKYSTKGLLP